VKFHKIEKKETGLKKIGLIIKGLPRKIGQSFWAFEESKIKESDPPLVKREMTTLIIWAR
jgi:hypothetical protein